MLERASRPHWLHRPIDPKQVEPFIALRRYVREYVGTFVNLDYKALERFNWLGDREGQCSSRGVGWEAVYVCIGEAFRMRLTDAFPDHKATSAIAFLETAVAYYNSLGLTVTRAMADSGPRYKVFSFRDAYKYLGLNYICTRLFPPRTFGKTERFIKTIVTEWAYGMAYRSSDQSTAALAIRIHRYNWHPHMAA